MWVGAADKAATRTGEVQAAWMTQLMGLEE